MKIPSQDRNPEIGVRRLKKRVSPSPLPYDRFARNDISTQTVAYLRVSTPSQQTEKDKAEVLRLANDRDLGKVTFVEETASGKVHWRQRAIGTIIEELHEGDNLIIPEISRLGRSLLEIFEILSVLLSRGIAVYAVKNNWELKDDLKSKMIAFCFSLSAEIEHDLISQRTKAALAARRAAGVKLGRPRGPGKSRLDTYRPEIEAFLKNGARKTWIANRYGVLPGTLHNWLRKNEIAIQVDTQQVQPILRRRRKAGDR